MHDGGVLGVGALQGLRPAGSFHGRPVIRVGEPVPLVGHIAFGVIDRGTNIIQVRPSTLCPHNCVFCSVDAGPNSRTRAAEFQVEEDWLQRWVKELVAVKTRPVEILLDGVGEPLTHPRIARVIELMRDIPGVSRVALETHGGFLSKSLAKKLDQAGLDRINLSVDSGVPERARMLAGVEWYEVERVLRVAEWIIENTGIDVVLTPVYVPGISRPEDVKPLIEWARRAGAGKKSGWPTGVLIQKYEVHRYGRKPQGARNWPWGRFYKWLRQLEQETGYRLLVDFEELGYTRDTRLEEPYKRGERVPLTVLGPGWHHGEHLAVDRRWTRVFSLFPNRPLPAGSRVNAVVVRSKDNIYVARV